MLRPTSFQGISRIMTRRAGRVSRLPVSRGASRGGSRGLTRRFGSGQEVLKFHGLGQVWLDHPDSTQPASGDLTRKKPCKFPLRAAVSA